MSSKPLQLILVVLCLVSVPAFSQAPQPDTPQLEKNVDELLSKLSLEQKIGLLTGTDDMFTCSSITFLRLGCQPSRCPMGPLAFDDGGRVQLIHRALQWLHHGIER